MFEFFAKGGILVIPILMCSVLAVAIFFERIIRFAKMRSRGEGLAEKVAVLLTKGNTNAALQTAEKSNSPMGRVLVQAIGAKDLDRDMLETVIVNATDEEGRNMSTYIQALATIGNI